MWIIAFLALTLMSASALPDNDNYILYADDIGGYPVLSSDGYLYLIGPNITKVNLVTKTAEKEIEIYFDSTFSNKIDMDKGVLNNDESFLIVYSTLPSGPN